MRKVYQMCALIPLLLTLAGCDRSSKGNAPVSTIGDPERGQQAMAYYGCASCHVVPGVPGAQGLIGPSLKHVGSRTYIAGIRANTPINLTQWIENAPALNPKTAMPDLEIPEPTARDIASYLYTLQ